MIYHDTRRDFWSLPQTGTKFLLTLLLLGATTTLLTSALSGSTADGGITSHHPLICQAIAVISGAKLLFELAIFRHLREQRNTPQRRTARLLLGRLGRLTFARFAIGALGGVIIPLLAAGQPAAAAFPVVAIFILTLAGEFLERTLYFAAVVAPKMPGGAPT
jgi:DMSO reductase anchor subunit